MTEIKTFFSSNGNGKKLTVEELARDEETGLYWQRHTSEPGFEGTRHKHTDWEWVYGLEGELIDDFGRYVAPFVKINTKDSVHKSHTEKGVRLLIFTRGQQIPVEEK